MIVEWIIFGGIAFWVITGILALLLLWAASDDRGVASGVMVLLYAFMLYMFGNVSTIHLEGWMLYIGIPAYFAIGIAWALVKWALFVYQQASDYRTHKLEFMLMNRINHGQAIPGRLQSAWRDYCRGLRINLRPPHAAFYKSKIMTWMVFWPTSMAWSLVAEPWKHLYSAFSGLFQGISDRIFARIGAQNDFGSFAEGEQADPSSEETP